MSTSTAADQVTAARQQLGEALLRLHGQPSIASADDLVAVDSLLFRVAQAMDRARDSLWAEHPGLDAEVNRDARACAGRILQALQASPGR